MIMISEKHENILFLQYINNNDESSFNELFKIIDKWLYPMIYRITGNSAVAEDIIQQTWMQIIENAKKFNPEKGLITNYIHSTAKNLALKWIKRESKKYDSQMEQIKEKYNNVNQFEFDELKVIVQKCIYRIRNKNHLDAILLYYFADLKIQEIKVLLDTNDQNVKSWLLRGRKELESELSKYINKESILEILNEHNI
jgi:RNA polymerase sigma-70 factor (ECF subfamily)